MSAEKNPHYYGGPALAGGVLALSHWNSMPGTPWWHSTFWGSIPWEWRKPRRWWAWERRRSRGWRGPGLATSSTFFCFLFVKKHWFAWRAIQWTLIGETLFSSVPPSNSLVSVSDPRLASWAEAKWVRENALIYTDPWLWKVNRIEWSWWPELQSSCQRPIVLLTDVVSGEDLGDIIQFIYTGSVAVSKPRLGGFVKSAGTLQIKGIDQSSLPGLVTYLILVC